MIGQWLDLAIHGVRRGKKGLAAAYICSLWAGQFSCHPYFIYYRLKCAAAHKILSGSQNYEK
jgi:hypothetical protein